MFTVISRLPWLKISVAAGVAFSLIFALTSYVSISKQNERHEATIKVLAAQVHAHKEMAAQDARMRSEAQQSNREAVKDADIIRKIDAQCENADALVSEWRNSLNRVP